MATDAERIAALETDNARLRAAYDSVTTSQLTREDLKGMDPLAIDRARRDGRLRDILSIDDRRVPPNNRDWKPAPKK